MVCVSMGEGINGILLVVVIFLMCIVSLLVFLVIIIGVFIFFLLYLIVIEKWVGLVIIMFVCGIFCIMCLVVV